METTVHPHSWSLFQVVTPVYWSVFHLEKVRLKVTWVRQPLSLWKYAVQRRLRVSRCCNDELLKRTANRWYCGQLWMYTLWRCSLRYIYIYILKPMVAWQLLNVIQIQLHRPQKRWSIRGSIPKKKHIASDHTSHPASHENRGFWEGLPYRGSYALIGVKNGPALAEEVPRRIPDVVFHSFQKRR